MTNKIRAHFDFIICEGNTGKIVFDNGKVIYDNKFEALMYHLIKFKVERELFEIPNNIPNTYYIGKTKIYHNRKADKVAL